MSQPQNIKELFKENQKKIIEQKEKFYDKIINSLKLDEKKLDILVVVLILAIVIIFFTQSK